MEQFKEFYLLRKKDISGTSGVGIVARGQVFPSGAAILEWLTFHSSICIYKSLEDVKEIHGHNGATEIILGKPKEKRKINYAKIRK